MKRAFRSPWPVLGTFALCVSAGAVALDWRESNLAKIGKQVNGQTLVSSGQIVESESFAFRGRPAEIALHPNRKLYAFTVMSQVEEFVKGQILLGDENGPIAGTSTLLGHHPAVHGMAWSPDGRHLVCSVGEKYDDKNHGNPTSDGVLEVFSFDGSQLAFEREVKLNSGNEPDNPTPLGLCFNRSGDRLYVACEDLNAVLELDSATFQRVRKLPVAMLPYDVKLSGDGSQLVVSNWGGRIPRRGDRVSKTGNTEVVVDRSGAATTGVVSLVNVESGKTDEVSVGTHPTDILVDGNKAYVCCSMSDAVSTIDLAGKKLLRSDRLAAKERAGLMPTALSIFNHRLLVSLGGENALAEFDISSGKVLGLRPTGYYPVGSVVIGTNAYMINSKGNGSIANTRLGKPGNAHQFEGTITKVDLRSDLSAATEAVTRNNTWFRMDAGLNQPVFNGAIKHVVYIIKENKTYDQIFGDLGRGNGDPKLCILGESIMPNHRAIAREFTLFDNAYVSGTNSGDGHQWSTQAMANDYVERNYVNYRTYNDDGNCAMSLSSHGTIWESAAAKGLSVRDYGEFVVADDATFIPHKPKDWFEAWQDRVSATHKFTFVPHARVPGIAPYVHPTVHYWPLIQSDQSRADEFIADMTSRIESNTVPSLVILSLPCDHTEGADPMYPQPKSMMADNDLALGRVVDSISHSKIWRDTCIFVIEDDSQSGLDHVDGHRTPYMVISPYNRRHEVDSHFYTTTSMLRTIELMLGFGPMNRFDAMAQPITTCFGDRLDLTPYNVRPNNIPLDLPNPGRTQSQMTAEDKYWYRQTKALDWSEPDSADPNVLDRIIWHNVNPRHAFPSNLPKQEFKNDD